MKVSIIKSFELETELFYQLKNLISEESKYIHFDFIKSDVIIPTKPIKIPYLYEKTLNIELIKLRFRSNSGERLYGIFKNMEGSKIEKIITNFYGLYEHLDDVSKEFVLTCYRLLSNPSVPGKMEEGVETWDKFFSAIEAVKKNRDPNELDILVTNIPNQRNFFCGIDNRNNAFIHARDWNRYVECSPVYPIIHTIVAIIFQTLINGGKSFEEFMHIPSRGCINDFCINKYDVQYKLRTADVCRDCLEKTNKLDIGLPVIASLKRLLELSRSGIIDFHFADGKYKLSRLKIDRKYRLFLIDYDLEIKLSPLEKALYLVILDNINGINVKDCKQYKKEFIKWYITLKPTITIAEAENRIEKYCNPTDRDISEIISKIKIKLVKLLGEKVASNYIIQGGRNQPKRITLNREYVDYFS